MLVSPAEPKAFLQLGPYSSEPERWGADFLAFPNGKTVACQRKECADLVASLRDDRIARELAQLQAADRAVLIIEGDWRWDTEGRCRLKGHDHGFLRSQLDGVCLSLQANGIWVMHTTGIADTIRLLSQIETFFTREKHTSLFTRPKSGSPWGNARSRDWSAHVYQSFPGIGIDTAYALYDKVGLPLHWDADVDFESVPGVGKKRAAALKGALNGASYADSDSTS